MRRPVRKQSGEAGQAVVLVVLAMGVFLLGALGLAIDGSHLYAERQMAQAAADGAAQAGIMSIFDGTTGAWGSYDAKSITDGASIPCTASGMSAASACKYAQANGFALSEVAVIPNPSITVSNLSASDTVNLLQVRVQRSVPTTLMSLLGSSASTVTATATAAILSQAAPIPIVITHPSNANTLSMNGKTSIVICGGPQRSIEINSSNGSAYTGGGTVDLSGAGPSDTNGNCKGTGSDFGVFGGQSTKPVAVLLGTTGTYRSPASPVRDPLETVYPDGPSQPTATPPQTGQVCTILGHCGDCPVPQFGKGKPPSTCTEYLPGLYNTGNGLVLKNVSSAIFDPGLYYISDGGGFTVKDSTVQMCSSCAADANTKDGMVIYNTGPASGTFSNAGVFNIDTGAYVNILGGGVSSSATPTAPSGPYYGVLFFQDRNSVAHRGSAKHTFGQGDGCFSLIGTVYVTNTLSIMQNDATHYQAVEYNGNPCSTTIQEGELVVGTLSLVGSTSIKMQLIPQSYRQVRQIALVQ